MFEKIIVFAVIFVMLSCTVYTTVHIVKSIVKKQQSEPEKEGLCDTCKHLVLKGGDIILTDGKYKCEVYNGFFCKAPEYCKGYSRREEPHDKTATN